MRKATTILSLLVLLGVLPGWRLPPASATGTAPPSPQTSARPSSAALHLPWREAGWTPEEAAAHLLNRFAYGPRPGEVEEVVRIGPDRWFATQLAADQPDAELAQRLAALPTLRMSTAEILAEYPPAALLLRQARAQGLLPARGGAPAKADETMRDSMADVPAAPQDQASDLRKSVLRRAREQGKEPERRLLEDQMTQKLLRAVTARNQLAEVMTDFWFNHFNVSFTKPQVRPFLISYERDAIRPFALGHFRDLLGATAHHPAMLAYLDNLRSSAPEGAVTKMAVELERRPLGRGRSGFAARGGAGAFGGRGAFGAGLGPTDGRGGIGRRGMPVRPGALGQRRADASAPDAPGAPPPGKPRPQGLNENYARELMELHTLGVDGGYDQKDVVEVARAFTGWSVMPIGDRREGVERRLSRARAAGGLGFQESGDFLFRADQHDAGSKTVLGVRLPSGRGIEDGEQVLDLLAAHRSTARHLATELAARFVADAPPPALIDRLTAEYLRTNGDVRRLLTAIAESPEFWSRANRAAKIKSPLELVASAVRATGGGVSEAGGLSRWVARLGEPLYANPVPTGFADRGPAWINSGTLLARMNFGLDLAAGKIPGVIPGAIPSDGRTAPDAAAGQADRANGATGADNLRRYATALLPGRDLAATLDLLAAAQKAPAPGPSTYDFASLTAGQKLVGVLLGSPEFQRR
jgi:uncharacterized protein (DUF1800 family)